MDAKLPAINSACWLMGPGRSCARSGTAPMRPAHSRLADSRVCLTRASNEKFARKTCASVSVACFRIAPSRRTGDSQPSSWQSGIARHNRKAGTGGIAACRSAAWAADSIHFAAVTSPERCRSAVCRQHKSHCSRPRKTGIGGGDFWFAVISVLSVHTCLTGPGPDSGK